jgi:hypothetical protein
MDTITAAPASCKVRSDVIRFLHAEEQGAAEIHRRLCRVRGVSQKYPAIFNISRTGRVAFMKLGSQSEETFLRIREQSFSRAASQSLVGRC